MAADKLTGYDRVHKIKLRTASYRLAYECNPKKAQKMKIGHTFL